MNGALAVARRELRTFFASPIAYIVLGGFLLLAGWLYFSTLFLAGQASLRGFFGTAPVLFALLVPAITMRSVAEERKSGTLELLLTMPLEDWQVVLGKYLAALGMVIAGLVFTLPYAFTVRALTAEGVAFDWGPVAAGYLGLALLASAFIALGLWASALSRNQIVGFIIGLLVCLSLYLVDKFAVLLPSALAQALEYLSADYHFENIARGVIDTRDVLYYLTLTAAGLVLTTQVLGNLRHELKPGALASPTVFTAAVLGSLVLLNVLSVRLFARFDVTADGAYTLAKGSKETLAALDDTVTVTAYFTKDLPAPYSSSARYVRDLLEEFRAASRGKVAFEFIDPAAQETDADKEAKREVKRDIFGRSFREQTAQEKELAAAGVQAVEIRVIEADQQQTKRAYLGLVIRHDDKKEVIPVVQNLSTLEYDLTSLIRKLTRPKTPVIALLQGHDEPKLEEKLRQLHSVLSQTYEVRPVTLGSQERFAPDIDAVMVLGPKKALAPNEVKALDQLVLEGKPAAFFLDSVSVDLRSFQPAPVDHGLSALLGNWGVTLSEQTVADAVSASLNIQEQRGFMLVQMPVPYPFIPRVRQLEPGSPISRGLQELTFPFATKVTAASADGRTAEVLARSSKKSWLESGKPPNLDPRREWRSEAITPDGPHELMVAVSGKFKSLFADQATVSQPPGTPALLAKSKADARIVVAGTSALFHDDFMQRPNAALLLNVADWMLLDPALLAMRSRGLQLAQLKAELSDGTRNAAKFGNAFGLPLALALLGVVRWRVREGRRAQVAL